MKVTVPGVSRFVFRPMAHVEKTATPPLAIEGTWINRTEYWKARHRGEDVVPSQFGTDYEIQLEPLPCWAHLEEAEWRRFVCEMVEDIEQQTLENHRRDGTAPAGATAVCQR